MREELDRATSARLSKLRAIPVDTSRLQSRLLQAIPRPANRLAWRFRPLRAVAASVLLVGALAVSFVAWSSRPALASASVMAQMHQDLVSGKTPVVQVDSIDEASRSLAAQASGLPPLPDLPAEHVMACCMKSVRNKRVACVLMRAEGVPVTMVVANAGDIRVPECPMVMVNGVHCHVQSAGELNMVMTEHHGRWVCLIGALPTGKLMEIAGRLKL